MTKRAVRSTLIAGLTLAVLAVLTVLAPVAGATIDKRKPTPSPAAEPTAGPTAQDPTIHAPAPPLLSWVTEECDLTLAAPETQAASASNGRGPKPKCGNGTCEAGESSSTCPSDCPADGGGGGGGGALPIRCGDRICAWPTENINTCPFDCPCQTPFGGPIC